MLILSAGKGGSGKTTITAQLLGEHVRRGGHAVGLDCDTNQALHKQFAGADQPPPLTGAIGRRMQLLYATNSYVSDPDAAPKSTPPAPGSPLFDGLSAQRNPLVAGAHRIQGNGVVSMRTGEMPPQEQLSHCNHFLVGAGLRLGLHTVIGSDELLIADMMAGNDNATSGLPSVADGAFVVVEPTAESLDAYRQILDTYTQLGVPHIAVVANQVEDADDLAFISERVDRPLACVIARDKQFFRALQAGGHPPLPPRIADELGDLHDVIARWQPEPPEQKYLRVVDFHNRNYPEKALSAAIAATGAHSYARRVRQLRETPRPAAPGMDERPARSIRGPRAALRHLAAPKTGTDSASPRHRGVQR